MEWVCVCVINQSCISSVHPHCFLKPMSKGQPIYLLPEVFNHIFHYCRWNSHFPSSPNLKNNLSCFSARLEPGAAAAMVEIQGSFVPPRLFRVFFRPHLDTMWCQLKVTKSLTLPYVVAALENHTAIKRVPRSMPSVHMLYKVFFFWFSLRFVLCNPKLSSLRQRKISFLFSFCFLLLVLLFVWLLVTDSSLKPPFCFIISSSHPFQGTFAQSPSKKKKAEKNKVEKAIIV